MSRYKIGEHFHESGNLGLTIKEFESKEIRTRQAIRNHYQAVHKIKISKTESIDDIRARVMAVENKPATGIDAMKEIRS